MVAARELHPLAPPPRVGLRGQSLRSEPADHVRELFETSPTESSVGLYLHVPFCTKRCYFCSFNTAPMVDEAMARYLDAVDREDAGRDPVGNRLADCRLAVGDEDHQVQTAGTGRRRRSDRARTSALRWSRAGPPGPRLICGSRA